jgi:hypothetical protein
VSFVRHGTSTKDARYVETPAEGLAVADQPCICGELWVHRAQDSQTGGRGKKESPSVVLFSERHCCRRWNCFASKRERKRPKP